MCLQGAGHREGILHTCVSRNAGGAEEHRGSFIHFVRADLADLMRLATSSVHLDDGLS